MVQIRRLPTALVNQIAAGEVVERPASILKELVENSLDAEARRIRVSLVQGGIERVQVEDDGAGMPREDLALALERHATSKIEAEDLSDLRWFGFRGEALPAIASVAQLSLASRKADAEHGWELEGFGAKTGEPRPVAMPPGTRVRVERLFEAVPARRKFLKSPRSEAMACRAALQRLAIAHPGVHFELSEDGKQIQDLVACSDLRARLVQVWDAELAGLMLPVELERDGISLMGLTSPATLGRASGVWQHLYVNGRAVRDKRLSGLVRAAYRDVMPRDRFPMLVVFVQIAPALVDVNVHPAKTEVRFRQAELVQGALVRALKNALNAEPVQARPSGKKAGWERPPAYDPALNATLWSHAEQAAPPEPAARSYASASPPLSGMAEESPVWRDAEAPIAEEEAYPLGAALAQLHETYILAQNAQGLVLIDQHAAHERLVYEALKTQWEAQEVERQPLLVPLSLELEDKRRQALLDQQEALAQWGLELEAFGDEALVIRAYPALLARESLSQLVEDLADEILAWGRAFSLEEKLHHLAKTLACYGSIRAGRRLNQSEMNALLRRIESTPRAHQCNHGRPTYIHLSRSELETLFERR